MRLATSLSPKAQQAIADETDRDADEKARESAQAVYNLSAAATEHADQEVEANRTKEEEACSGFRHGEQAGPPAASLLMTGATGTSGCYIDLPDVGGFESFSVELWAKPYTPPGKISVALWLDLIDIRLGETELKVYVVASRTGGTGLRYTAECANAIKPSVWQHIAVSVAVDFPVVFVDGVLQSCNTFESRFSGSYFADLIGGHSESNTDPAATEIWPGSGYPNYEGELGEVRVWGTARTREEIALHMHEGLTGQEGGLAALWNFAGDTAASGSTCKDETGNFDGIYKGTCPTPVVK